MAIAGVNSPGFRLFFVGASLPRRLVCIHRFHDLRPIHDRFGQTGGHSGRHAQALVDANPIIPNRIDRDHVRMVLKLL